MYDILLFTGTGLTQTPVSHNVDRVTLCVIVLHLRWGVGSVDDELAAPRQLCTLLLSGKVGAGAKTLPCVSTYDISDI